MDKASIIKDAIDYIQELHDQEREIKREITELELELESGNQKRTPKWDRAENENMSHSKLIKKKRTDELEGVSATPVEVLDVSVLYLLPLKRRESEREISFNQAYLVAGILRVPIPIGGICEVVLSSGFTNAQAHSNIYFEKRKCKILANFVNQKENPKNVFLKTHKINRNIQMPEDSC